MRRFQLPHFDSVMLSLLTPLAVFAVHGDVLVARFALGENGSPSLISPIRSGQG